MDKKAVLVEFITTIQGALFHEAFSHILRHLKTVAYMGYFPDLYKDIISWSNGDSLVLEGIDASFSGAALVVPEEVHYDESLFDRYFLLTRKDGLINISSKCVFDLDSEILYSFFYKDLLKNPEINNMISNYDLQKAVGKSFKKEYHLGAVCPILIIDKGILQGVVFGGDSYQTLGGLATEMEIVGDPGLAHFPTGPVYPTGEVANEFTLISKNRWQHMRLCIKKEENNYKIYNSFLISGPNYWTYNDITSLKEIKKPFDLGFLTECFFSFKGFHPRQSGSSCFGHPQIKGTPLYIDSSTPTDSSLIELTSDLNSLVNRVFKINDNLTLEDLSSVFFYCNDVNRTTKKTDAIRYVKEECSPFFILRKNDHSKEMSENKSFSNYIRKALYPLENLVASIVFYADAKAPDKFRLDKNITVSSWNTRSIPPQQRSLDSASLFKSDQRKIVIDNLIKTVSTPDFIETNFKEFKKHQNESKYKHGLFDLKFFQSWPTSVEENYLKQLFAHLHTRSTRYFKSEKHFYIEALIKSIYTIKQINDSENVITFYAQNCTSCVPELDRLVSIGYKNMQWNDKVTLSNASVDISTVFTLNQDNVDMLKKVISFSRASEYQVFIDEYKSTLEIMINGLITSNESKTNLKFALEFLCEWIKLLSESEKSYIANNPNLVE